MDNLRIDGPPISGSFHSATRKGAAAVLKEANDAVSLGYELVGVEVIESGAVLFVIYKKRERTRPREALLVGE